MPATAISLASAVTAVAPMEGEAFDPDLAALTSRGSVVATPLSSTTVAAIAEAEVTATTTPPGDVIPVEFAAYHISWSVLPLWIASAWSHEFPRLSLTLLTVASEVALRILTTMTRRFPEVVGTLGKMVS